MEIVGIIVALISLGIGFFALYWARKEEVVQPKEVAVVRGDDAKGIQYPGTDQDDVAGDEAATKGEETTEVGHAAGNAKSVLPRPVVVTPGRGDQEGQHLVADGDEVGPVLQGLELRLYGFSSLTRGQLWLLVTPRSASNIVTGLERIEVPQVGMQGELPAGDAFLVAGGGDEFVGELGRLPWRDHPADYLAAEHVEVT
jgi:hypothetical protein